MFLAENVPNERPCGILHELELTIRMPSLFDSDIACDPCGDQLRKPKHNARDAEMLAPNQSKHHWPSIWVANVVNMVWIKVCHIQESNVCVQFSLRPQITGLRDDFAKIAKLNMETRNRDVDPIAVESCTKSMQVPCSKSSSFHLSFQTYPL